MFVWWSACLNLASKDARIHSADCLVVNVARRLFCMLCWRLFVHEPLINCCCLPVFSYTLSPKSPALFFALFSCRLCWRRLCTTR
jgi:hypothetical protein